MLDDCFLGEIRILTGSGCPEGWLPCDGREIKWDEYPNLWELLHGAFGDNTVTRLPDLRGRVPIGCDGTYKRGATGGSESVVLTEAQAAHTHLGYYSGAGSSTVPTGATPYPSSSTTVGGAIYADASDSNRTAMNAAMIGGAGLGHPHDNMQPFMALDYFICVSGKSPD